MSPHGAIVIGASAGGVQALLELLPRLPADFAWPVLVVLHVPADRSNFMAPLFASKCRMEVKEADDKESLRAGCIYFAPSDYHLLVETNGDLALSTEEAVNYSRPSIDVLFESAADTFGASLTAILLTGANDDGASGLRKVADAGGRVIIEDPATAYVSVMPEAGLKLCPDAYVASVQGIADYLLELSPI